MPKSARLPMAAALLLALPAAPAAAQESLPVIGSGTLYATVIDGPHVARDSWYIMPERKPDVYWVEMPRRPHRVTFRTDRDSISFTGVYGDRHRFIIRLEDGTDALTEIRAEHRELLPYTSGGAPDTIPFTLGDNDKIYLKGRINGSPLLDFQFDLGAGGSIINESSVPKVPMTFDGTVTLRNSDGVNEVPSSSSNRVEIAGIRWEGVRIAVAGNMTRREDALIGNGLFRDRVVEIDYGRMIITVHDTLPARALEGVREEMYLDGGTVPFVRGGLAVKGSLREGWYMLDTGAYTTILTDARVSSTTKFADEFRTLLGPLRRRRANPVIQVGGRTFSGTNYTSQPPRGDPAVLGLLGNDLLKRFDMVLDNRQGFVYLEPNQHLEEGYRNPERLVVRTTLAGIAVACGLIGFLRLRRSS